mgnify:CR=1 FL=1
MIEFQKVYDLFTEFGMSEPGLFVLYINPTSNEAECLPDNDFEFDDWDEEQKKLEERIENEPGWIAVPDEHDLELDSRLPLRFAEENLEPEDCDLVYDFFRHRGAYRNFRALLDRLGMTEKWYQYEDNAIREALKQWLINEEIEFSE